ncbi:MAG: hypothetical protein WBE20_09820 [Candidatus Acidiferrales bacterium]
MTVQAAIADLKGRTLPRLPGDIARLIYLAGTRDYNTGKYYHEGLARMFTEEIASRALQECHSEIFEDLIRSSIQDLLCQVELYVGSGCAETEEFVDFWEKIEPYRVAIPFTSDLVSAQLFNSNVKIALAILRHRGNNPRNSSPVASLRP